MNFALLCIIFVSRF